MFLNPDPIMSALLGIPACLGEEISLGDIAIRTGRAGIVIFDKVCKDGLSPHVQRCFWRRNNTATLPKNSIDVFENLIKDDQGSSGSFRDHLTPTNQSRHQQPSESILANSGK